MSKDRKGRQRQTKIRNSMSSIMQRVKDEAPDVPARANDDVRARRSKFHGQLSSSGAPTHVAGDEEAKSAAEAGHANSYTRDRAPVRELSRRDIDHLPASDMGSAASVSYSAAAASLVGQHGNDPFQDGQRQRRAKPVNDDNLNLMPRSQRVHAAAHDDGLGAQMGWLKRGRLVMVGFNWTNGEVTHEGFARCCSLKPEGPPVEGGSEPAGSHVVTIEYVRPFVPGYNVPQPGQKNGRPHREARRVDQLTPVELQKWNIKHVTDWVFMIGDVYGQYKSTFEENQIDGGTLMYLDLESCVSDLNVKKLHARAICNGINALKEALKRARDNIVAIKVTSPQIRPARDSASMVSMNTAGAAKSEITGVSGAAHDTRSSTGPRRRSPASLVGAPRRRSPAGSYTPSAHSSRHSSMAENSHSSPAMRPAELEQSVNFFLDSNLPAHHHQDPLPPSLDHLGNDFLLNQNTYNRSPLALSSGGRADFERRRQPMSQPRPASARNAHRARRSDPGWRPPDHHVMERAASARHAHRDHPALQQDHHHVQRSMSERFSGRRRNQLRPEAAPFEQRMSRSPRPRRLVGRQAMSEQDLVHMIHHAETEPVLRMRMREKGSHHAMTLPQHHTAPELYSHADAKRDDEHDESASHIWEYNDGLCSEMDHFGKQRIKLQVPGHWHRFPKAIEERIAKAARTGQRFIRYHIHNRHYNLQLSKGWSAKGVSYYKEENERDGRVRLVRYAKYISNLWTPQVGERVNCRIDNEWLDAEVCHDNGDGSYKITFGADKTNADNKTRRVMIEDMEKYAPDRNSMPSIKVMHRPDKIYSGKIVKYFGSSRYGFIESKDFLHDVFFHLSSVDGEAQVKRHARVEFGNIESGKRGWTANYVNITQKPVKDKEVNQPESLDAGTVAVSPTCGSRTIKLSPIPEAAKVGHILGALKWAIGKFKAKNRVQIEGGCCYIEFRSEQTFEHAMGIKSIPFGTQGFRINITKAEEIKLENGRIRVVPMYNGKIFRGRIIRVINTSGSGFLESRKRKGIYFPADQASDVKPEVGMYVDYQLADNPHPDFRGKVIAISLKRARLGDADYEKIFISRFPWLQEAVVLHANKKFNGDTQAIFEYLSKSTQFRERALVRIDIDTYRKENEQGEENLEGDLAKLLEMDPVPRRGQFVGEARSSSKEILITVQEGTENRGETHTFSLPRACVRPLEQTFCLTCGNKGLPGDDGPPDLKSFPVCLSMLECPDCERSRNAQGRQPGATGTLAVHTKQAQTWLMQNHKWTSSAWWEPTGNARPRRGECVEEVSYKGHVFALLSDGSGIVMHRDGNNYKYYYFMSSNGYPEPKLGNKVSFVRSPASEIHCDYRGCWEDAHPQWLRGEMRLKDAAAEGEGEIFVSKFGRSFKCGTLNSRRPGWNPEQMGEDGAVVYVQIQNGEIVSGPRPAEFHDIGELADQYGRIGVDAPFYARDSLLRVEADADEKAGGEGAKVEVEKKLFENLRNNGDVVQMADAAVKYINAFLNSNGGIILFGVDEEAVIWGQSGMTSQKRKDMIARIKQGLQSFKSQEGTPVPADLYDILEKKVVERGADGKGYVLPDVYVFVIQVKSAPRKLIPFRTADDKAWEKSWGSITTFRERLPEVEVEPILTSDRQLANQSRSFPTHSAAGIARLTRPLSVGSPHGAGGQQAMAARREFQAGNDAFDTNLDNNEVSI